MIDEKTDDFPKLNNSNLDITKFGNPLLDKIDPKTVTAILNSVDYIFPRLITCAKSKDPELRKIGGKVSVDLIKSMTKDYDENVKKSLDSNENQFILILENLMEQVKSVPPYENYDITSTSYETCPCCEYSFADSEYPPEALMLEQMMVMSISTKSRKDFDEDDFDPSRLDDQELEEEIKKIKQEIDKLRTEISTLSSDDGTTYLGPKRIRLQILTRMLHQLLMELNHRRWLMMILIYRLMGKRIQDAVANGQLWALGSVLLGWFIVGFVPCLGSLVYGSLTGAAEVTLLTAWEFFAARFSTAATWILRRWPYPFAVTAVNITAFYEALILLLLRNMRIVILLGELGYKVFDKISAYPSIVMDLEELASKLKKLVEEGKLKAEEVAKILQIIAALGF